MSFHLSLVIASGLLAAAVSTSDKRPEGECMGLEECGDSLLAFSHKLSSRRVAAEHKVMQHLAKSRKPTTGLVVSLRQLATDTIERGENCSEELTSVWEPVWNETQIVIDSSENLTTYDQEEVDAAYQRLLDCNISASQTESSKVQGARFNHSTCREQQLGIQQQKDSVCNAFNTLEESLHYPNCMYVNGTHTEVTGNCMQDISGFLSTYHDPFVQGEADCNHYETGLEEKEQSCDSKQSHFELSYCTWATLVNSSAASYTACFTHGSGDYVSVAEEVKTKQVVRVAEYKAAVQIQCLIGAMNATGSLVEKAELLSQCIQTQIDTSALDITYYDDQLPSMGNVTNIASVPCDDAWLQSEYMGYGWSSLTTTCSSCEE